MRKIAIYILVAMMTLTFAGCRSNMDDSPAGTTAPATQPSTTPPATTVPDTFGDVPNIPDSSVDNDTLEDLIPGDMNQPSR